MKTPKFLKILGIDLAVAFVILGRGWGVLAGLLNVYLVSHLLTGVEQGFYYTFNSIVALQVFFELGLSVVIAQFASHEVAQLSWNKSRELVGPTGPLHRLYSLVKFSTKWYGIVGPVVFLVVTPLGAYFFSSSSSNVDIPMSSWLPGWIALVFFTSLNLTLSPLICIGEGIGMVTQIAKMRLAQAMLGSISLWLGLYLGFGLAAIAIMPAVIFLVSVVWLKRNLLGLIRAAIRTRVQEGKISWRLEIMPMQWRIALSWLCGYLIYQLFTPIAFRFHGAEIAGQLGMSIAITAAISAVAMSWINTKMPLFGRLISERKFHELDPLFFRSLIQSFGVLLVLGIGVICAVAVLPYVNAKLSSRLLDVPTFSALIIAALANHIIFCEASYIRAFKKELFLPHALVMSVAILLVCGTLGVKVGVPAMLAGYAIVMVLIGVTYGHLIFSTFRKSSR